jgi:two-component system osmolarity sensor histidine kinase EnvZ
MGRPKTLFARTSLTIAAAMLALLLFFSGVVLYFILAPMARQASSDLGALIVLSAQTWVELPPQTRPDFEDELRSRHGITLAHTDAPLVVITFKTPYMRFLEEALAARLGQAAPLMVDPMQNQRLWVDIPMADRTLRMGFTHDRVRARPPIALFLLIIGAGIITLITSLLLVRRLTRPLAHLASATSRFGRGERPESLPEEGPEELMLLARNFNRMTEQVRQLLNNRTTLLGGISHDLRTPITQLQLAIELLPEDEEQALLDSMRRDLKQMDQLIGRTLELARGLEEGGREREERDLAALVAETLKDFTRRDKTIHWNTPPPCVRRISPIALRRVLANLLENALRYGGDQPLDVQFQCREKVVQIDILDRGPGIPEDQLEAVFQPFYRLEDSRSLATGGSGLGLAIVRQLCDRHGWGIELRPREGGGTDACLTIPRGTAQGSIAGTKL